MTRLSLCLAVLLLLPGAAAATPFLQGDAADARLAGHVDVHAQLAYFTSVGDGQPRPLEPSVSRIAPSSFSLHADRVDVSTDVRSDAVYAAGVGYGNTTQQQESHSQVALLSTSFRANFAFFVVPQPGATASADTIASEASLRPGDPGAQQSMHVDNGRTPLAWTRGDAAGWEAPSGWQTLTISGDFVMALWDVDLHGTDANGAAEVRSGYFFTSAVPVDSPVTLAGQAQSRQAYLTVHHGTLDITFSTAPSAHLALVAPSASARQLWLAGLTGTIDTPQGRQSVRAGDVQLTGDLRADFASSDHLGTTVTGTPDQAVVGGRTIAYAAAVNSVGSLPLWLMAVAAVAVVAAAGGRRLTLQRAMARVTGRMDDADYAAAAAAVSPRLLRSRRYRTDAQVVRTVALLQLGRLPEAQASLESWRGDSPAAVDYLWAFLHALRGDAARARSAIAACLRKDPSMKAEIEANPTFAALLGQTSSHHPGLRGREGYV